MHNQPRINVVYISPHVDGYGADKSLLNNVLLLKKMGVNPIFITPGNGALTLSLAENDIPYYIIGYKSWATGSYRHFIINILKTLGKFFINVVCALKMWRVLRKKDIHIVHTNDMIANFGMILSKFLKCKHIMHGRCLLHESSILFDIGTWRSLSIIDSNSDAIIFNSEIIYDYYKRYLKKSSSIIYSGIFSNIEFVKPVRQMPSYLEPVKFIFVGRYEKQKDPFVILKAIQLLLDRGIKNFTVSFYGKIDNSYKSYFEAMDSFVEKHELSNHVKFNGFVNNIKDVLKMYNVGLFTSPMEGIARVIIEYMINGLPVIGVNSGASAYLIKERINGLLFEPGNEEALANKMRLIVDDRSLLSSMSLKTYDSVGKNFSTEYTSEQIHAVYKTVLQG